MRNEPFPVKGFEFMDEPATDDQKEIIMDLMAKVQDIPRESILDNWPDPFSKWDAARMIDSLKEELEK